VPEPILLADVSTGEIVDANEAAASLLDRSREELVGAHQSDLHPKDAESQYRQLFARHADTEGTKRTLPDGSQIQVLTGDGEQVPVEINAKRHQIDDREVMVGVFRDISETVTREDTTSRESWYETFFETTR
jgi:PAS fold.